MGTTSTSTGRWRSDLVRLHLILGLAAAICLACSLESADANLETCPASLKDTETGGCLSLCGVCDIDNTYLVPEVSNNKQKLKELQEMLGWFDQQANKITEETLFEGTYGPKLTYRQHMDWLLDHFQEYSSPSKSGFRVVKESRGGNGEVDTVVEVHDEMTTKGGGAYYIRLKRFIDLSPEFFTTLMMEGPLVGAIDPTMQATVPVHEFQPPSKDEGAWLVYFSGTPGYEFLLNGFDGLDITGYKRVGGSIYQVALSVPFVLPKSPSKDRLIDLYWGVKLTPTQDANGKQRTEMILTCQSALTGWLPNFLTNAMVVDVLDELVKNVERLGRQLIQAGREEELLRKYRFL